MHKSVTTFSTPKYGKQFEDAFFPSTADNGRMFVEEISPSANLLFMQGNDELQVRPGSCELGGKFSRAIVFLNKFAMHENMVHMTLPIQREGCPRSTNCSA